MRFSKALSLACAALLAGPALAIPLELNPGSASSIVLTDENTVNTTTSVQSEAVESDSDSTSSSSSPAVHMLTTSTTSTTEYIELSFVNNLDSTGVNAYVTGLDVNGALVMLYPNGTWYYPPATTATVPVEVTADIAIPLGGEGTTTSIRLPGYITAGRIWFADGELTFYTVAGASGSVSLVEPSAVNPTDPSAAVNWGFVELTYDADAIYTNLSYVDFVGLPLGQTLTDCAGNTQSALGVSSTAVDDICADLEEQTCVDGYPWDELCATDSSGTALRVLAPYDYISLYPTAFEDYFTDYVDEVWTYYSSTPLTIDTQASAGDVNCTVSGSNMTCAGDNRSYAKPTAADIFGCSTGTFAIESTDNDIHVAVVPRLCAAFHRGTFLLSGGNVQPIVNESTYYTSSPSNFYAKFVKSYEMDGRGYAFAYDDVTPTGGSDSSGLLSSTEPALLTITVGGD